MSVTMQEQELACRPKCLQTLLRNLFTMAVCHGRTPGTSIYSAGATALIIVIFFAVALVLLFVFFLVWLLSKEDIGRYRVVRRV
jgi:hypothetical protein